MAKNTACQTFLNSDLDGRVTGLSALPNDWQSVPYTDINCEASFNAGSSPDLTNLVDPSIPNGIFGAPFSGLTFLSGIRLNVVGLVFHEGIMQTVSGFCPGKSYIIDFQQAVVKQKNGIDSSGSWSVYFDNTLAGTTLPSINSLPFNSSAFIWEARSITFTATATSHTIKFLPKDDDANNAASLTDPNGALRMGIDQIVLTPSVTPIPLNLGNDTTLCAGETLVLDVAAPNSSYLWQDNSTKPSFNITGPGTYFVEVTTSCGNKSDTINVNYNNTPTVNLGNDTTLCQGETLTLDATASNVNYLWQDNSGNPTFRVTAAGSYWVLISDSCGTSSDTINVNFNPLPNIDLGKNTKLCQGQTLTLNISAPNATYLWQNNSTDSVLNVTAPGTYWAQLTNSCGTKSDTVNINYNSLASVNLGNDTVLCPGRSLLLDANNPNVNYIWQDNSTNATFRVNNAGTYWVQISDSCGTSSDTINVSYAPIATVDIGKDTNLCQGETLTLNAGTPNCSYLWQDNSNTSSYRVTTQGIYWVRVSNKCGSSYDTVNVNINPTPSINLSKYNTLCEGKTLILDATTPISGSTYLWQDNSTEPTFTVENEGTYWAQITNNCKTVSDTVVIDMENCNCTFFIPNSFTPNSDSDNDYFFPKFNCKITEYSFVIFNRWGDLIFQTNSQKSYWDGNFRGSQSKTGVYVYLIKYKHNGKDNTKSGRVSLLR